MFKYLSLFCCLNFIQSLAAQPQPYYRNLIFEGGGVRGDVFTGAYMELQKHIAMDSVKNVGGSSAGAIIATAIAFKATTAELDSIMQNTDFGTFNDGKLGGIFRMFSHYGYFKGKRFTNFVASYLEMKTGNPDITFAEMKQMGYKNLYVTGTCMDCQSVSIFSYETYPNMKVKDAIRISMSVPLYFKAIFLDEKGNIYQHQNKEKSLHIYADGGILMNYPIRIFDSTKFVTNMQYLHNQFIYNTETLGFRVESEAQTTWDNQGKHQNYPIKIRSLSNYLHAFYEITIGQIGRRFMTPEDWQRTITISDGGVSPRVRSLPMTVRQKMQNNGKEAVKHFFENVTH